MVRRHTAIERGAIVVFSGAIVDSASSHGPSSWNSNVAGSQPALAITYSPPADQARTRDSVDVSGTESTP